MILVSSEGFNQSPGWRSVSVAQARRGPTVVEIPSGVAGLGKASVAVCHQVTTLDRAKLSKQIGLLPPDLAKDLDDGLKAALDLD